MQFDFVISLEQHMACLNEHYPAKISKFQLRYLIICMLHVYCQMRQNMQLNYLDKKILQSTTEAVEVQDCKDGSVLQFIKFDFVTGSQKIAILVKF